MSGYPTLMQGQLEKFEELFYYKKKALDEFVSLMNDRADLEESYARNLEKISASMAVLAEKGPLQGIIHTLKVFDNMKAEQSRTFALSIKDEISTPLKNFVKNQAVESKKILNEGAKNDYDLKLMLEKLENAKKSMISNLKDQSEAEKQKTTLSQLIEPKPNTEEKIKALEEKLTNFKKSQQELDDKLKANIEEYNTQRLKFTDEANRIINFYKEFDVSRMNQIKDASLKYFIFQISLIRNVQYDVDRLISKVETFDFSNLGEESSLFTLRKEPAAMDHQEFKDLFIKYNEEEKVKNGIIFEKIQIPSDDFGLGTAFKSFVGLFSNPKSAEAKKKEEDKKLIEKRWKAITKGEVLKEDETKTLLELFTRDYNREAFLNLLVKFRIKPNFDTDEDLNNTKDLFISILKKFFDESLEQKDWKNLMSFIAKYKELLNSKVKSLELADQIYQDVENIAITHQIFKNEEFWKDFFRTNLENDRKKNTDDEAVMKTFEKSIKVMKKYVKETEKAYEVIKVTAEKSFVSAENVDTLLKMYDEIKSIDSSPSREESFDEWVSHMERKITEVQKSQKKEVKGKIFAEKTEISTFDIEGSPLNTRHTINSQSTNNENDQSIVNTQNILESTTSAN